jgi:hypothetical protein
LARFQFAGKHRGGMGGHQGSGQRGAKSGVGGSEGVAQAGAEVGATGIAGHGPIVRRGGEGGGQVIAEGGSGDAAGEGIVATAGEGEAQVGADREVALGAGLGSERIAERDRRRPTRQGNGVRAVSKSFRRSRRGAQPPRSTDEAG